MEENKIIITTLVYGIIFVVLITCGLILLFHYSRKKIIQKEVEKVTILLDQQKKVIQATITTQEEERKRIAQDMHDAISSKLNVVNLTTHLLLADESINEEQRNSLSHILEINSKTLESSRKIAHDLLPPVLDKFGLKVALEELFEEFTKSNQIEIKSNIEELSFLNSTVELHIFRILQELINNSIRHGKAKLLDIKLVKVNETGFELNYNDDGIGFDSEKISKNSGIGLQNIESRVAILNGIFTVTSTPEKGSTFIVNCATNG